MENGSTEWCTLYEYIWNIRYYVIILGLMFLHKLKFIFC